MSGEVCVCLTAGIQGTPQPYRCDYLGYFRRRWQVLSSLGAFEELPRGAMYHPCFPQHQWLSWQVEGLPDAFTSPLLQTPGFPRACVHESQSQPGRSAGSRCLRVYAQWKPTACPHTSRSYWYLLMRHLLFETTCSLRVHTAITYIPTPFLRATIISLLSSLRDRRSMGNHHQKGLRLDPAWRRPLTEEMDLQITGIR